MTQLAFRQRVALVAALAMLAVLGVGLLQAPPPQTANSTTVPGGSATTSPDESEPPERECDEDGSPGEPGEEPQAEPPGEPESEPAAESEECEPGGPGEEEGEAAELRQRDDWFFDRRRNSKGRIPAGAWARAQRQAEALRTSEALLTTPLNWTELGPQPINPPIAGLNWEYGGSTPYAGRVTSIATHPTNKDIAVIGTANGGVWKTTNGGVDWTQIFDNAPVGAAQAIGAVAFDPKTPTTIYVGTGEANFTLSGYFGTGLYRWTDASGQWTKLGPDIDAGTPGKQTIFDDCSFSSIVVKPDLPDTILVGVTGGDGKFTNESRCIKNSRSGLYRSINGGDTWNQEVTGYPTKVVVAPNDAKVFYAGFWGSGVWRSTDSGDSWGRVGGTTMPSTNVGRVEVAVAAATGPGGGQTLYASLATGDALLGVYRSNNSGDNWAQLAAPTNYCHGQCSYDLTMAIDPADPNRAFAGGVYLNRYSSNSASLIGWGKPGGTNCPTSAPNATTTCIHVDFHATTFDVARRLWVGSDGGVYRLNDPAAATPFFTNLNNDLNAVQYYPGVSGLVSSPPLVGGAQDNGTSWYNGAANFNLVGWADGGSTATVANRTAVITSWQYARPHRLIKVNGTWTFCPSDETSGITDAGNDKGFAPFIAPLVGGAVTTNNAYIGTWRIFRTTTANLACGSMTWSKISQDFTYPSGQQNLVDHVTAIGVTPNGGVYAATRSGRFYASDGTAQWPQKAWPTGVTGRIINDIWVDPAQPATVYVAISGFDADSTRRQIFRSTTGGASWDRIGSNLPNTPANAVVVDTSTTPVTIYVGTDVGVFWSSDNGLSWQNTSIGLPGAPVMDLLLDGNKLIAATFGRGMWTAPKIGSAPAGPSNDNFANAKAITSIPYSDTGVNTANATTEQAQGEIVNPDCTDFQGKTVWYRYSPTVSRTVTLNTGGSSFDTVILAYRGTTLSNLVQIGCDDVGVVSTLKDVRVDANQTYYFQIGGWYETAGGTPASGTLSISLAEGAPLHDKFSFARTVGTLPYSDSAGTNVLAGVDANEVTQLPDTCSTAGTFIGKTVWYKYAPTSNVTVTADTIGSEVNFDTVLVAWDGATLQTLARVGCDDDGGDKYPDPNGGSSKLPPLSLLSGHTYYFQVGGWGDTVGGADSGSVKFNLKVSPTGNDLFANAITIGSLPYTEAGRSTATATADGEPVPSTTCVKYGVGNTVWYKFVAGSNMTVTADTIGSGFDTVITVYQGATLATLSQVACDDDSGNATTHESKITGLSLTAGQTYYFQVGGWKSSTGTIYTGNLTFHLKTP